MGARYGRTLLLVLLFLTSCFQQPDQGPPKGGVDTNPWEGAYNGLSPEDKARVDNGELVFTGIGFVVPPAMLERPTSIDRAGFSPLEHIKGWPCPLAKPEGDKDHGTFFLYGTYNGDATPGAESGLNFGSASFILPPPGNISVGAGETAYAMLGGWAPENSGTAFDAGFGWEDPASVETKSDSSGWFFFTNRFIAQTPEMRARKYRLLNMDNGNAAVTVDFTMEIDGDGHLLATATATGATRWVNPHVADDPGTPGNEAVLTDPATGQPVLTLTLGGSEEGVDENDGRGPLPVQSVPGFVQNGHDNVFSMQVNLATFDYTDPAIGSYARGIGVYALKVGYFDAPSQVLETNDWDIDTAAVTLFHTKCPGPNWENAYDVNGGNTASATASGAFMIDIDIEEEDIHNASKHRSNITEPNHNPVEMSAMVGASTSGSSSFKNLGDELLTYSLSESANWLTINSPHLGHALVRRVGND
jgi:hypothetical protein